VQNVISVQNCRFDGNRRYGVGLVDQKTEKLSEHHVSAAIFAGQNQFTNADGADVSANYRGVFDAPQRYPARIQVTLTTGKGSQTSEHAMHVPVLVGVYDFKAMTDGTNCQDTEGVAVSSARVYVPDDDVNIETPAI